MINCEKEKVGAKIEKCYGEVSTLADASAEKIPEYTDLFKESYDPKRHSESRSAQDDCLSISHDEPIEPIIENHGVKWYAGFYVHTN